MVIIGKSQIAGGGIGKGLEFTYTGDYTEREDGVIELRSSGTFVPARDYVIDTFHVGGGAGGYAVTAAAGGPGGGSGYTKTQRNVSIKKGQQYIITVGLGGSGKAAGGRRAGDGVREHRRNGKGRVHRRYALHGHDDTGYKDDGVPGIVCIRLHKE